MRPAAQTWHVAAVPYGIPCTATWTLFLSISNPAVTVVATIVAFFTFYLQFFPLKTKTVTQVYEEYIEILPEGAS